MKIKLLSLILTATVLLIQWQVPAQAAEPGGSVEALTVGAMQARMREARDQLPSVTADLVKHYPAQASEVICTGINTDSSQTHDLIAAAMGAGATGDQIPPACACTESNEGIASLVEGALTNGISAADLASSCLREVTDAELVQALLADLLAAAGTDDMEFILGTTYDALVDLKVDNAADILVDTLVNGNYLSFDGLADCGDACVRPAAETLVQSIIDVQQGGGLAGDLVGEPSRSEEPQSSLD